MDFDITPLWVSAKTSILATFIAFFLAILVAYFMDKKNTRLSSFLDTLFILPMVLPPTVLGFFLLLILGKNAPIGKLLSTMNINIIFSFGATVIAATTVAFPLIYKTTRGALKQADITSINAARTLGVSEWRIFWTLTLPMCWPGIAAGTVLGFTRALGEFGATLMVAGNIPGKTQTIPIAIYFAVEDGEMDKAIIWVLIIFILSLTIIFLSNYWTNNVSKATEGSNR